MKQENSTRLRNSVKGANSLSSLPPHSNEQSNVSVSGKQKSIRTGMHTVTDISQSKSSNTNTSRLGMTTLLDPNEDRPE